MSEDLFSWAEVIRQRELLERQEREEVLRKGREEWARIQNEITTRNNRRFNDEIPW